MFLKFILFLIGILFTSFGIINIILYLNLCVIGYSFFFFFNFIIRKLECLCIIVGIFLIWISIFFKGEKNEICK